MINNKLSNKVIAILFISITIIQVVLGLARYTYFKESEINKIKQTITHDADELAYSLTYPLWNLNDIQMHRTILFKMDSGNFLAIFLYNNNNEILENMTINEQNKIAFEANPDSIKTQLDHAFLKIDKEIVKSDETIGRLEIYVSDKTLQAELSNLIIYIIFEMVILTIISVLIIYLSINALVLKRIRKLTDFVTNYSPNNKQQSIEKISNDEIGSLGRAFNKMIESLKYYNKELETINTKLEEKIEKRTEALAEKNRELEAFNSLVVNRELKMISLKEEITKLQEEMASLKKSST